MLAVSNGHKDVTQLLVDHGAHVDSTDKHLRTALHRAVSGRGQEHDSSYHNSGYILRV